MFLTFSPCIPEEEQLQFCDVLVAGGGGSGRVFCVFVCLQVHVEVRGSGRCLSIGDIHLFEREQISHWLRALKSASLTV